MPQLDLLDPYDAEARPAANQDELLEIQAILIDTLGQRTFMLGADPAHAWRHIQRAFDKATPGSIVKVLADPAIQARMRNVGAIAVASKSPEEFKAYMDAETAKWTRVIQENGLHSD